MTTFFPLDRYKRMFYTYTLMLDAGRPGGERLGAWSRAAGLRPALPEATMDLFSAEDLAACLRAERLAAADRWRLGAAARGPLRPRGRLVTGLGLLLVRLGTRLVAEPQAAWPRPAGASVGGAAQPQLARR